MGLLEGRYVAVVGAGVEDPATDRVAEELGEALATEGAVVVCGGLGGVMAAACRGAKAVGGPTLGILPGTDRDAANPWADLVVATGLGEVRNALVVRAADAVVAVGGEFGTLSEIAFALKTGKPVVGLGTWQLAKQGQSVATITEATSPADAVAQVGRRIRESA